jgi:hypothetical protein
MLVVPTLLQVVRETRQAVPRQARRKRLDKQGTTRAAWKRTL